MMCPCGTTEMRAASTNEWREFRVTEIRRHRYHLVCLHCSHSSVYHMKPDGELSEPRSRILQTLDRLIHRAQQDHDDADESGKRAIAAMAWARSGHGRRRSDDGPKR